MSNRTFTKLMFAAFAASIGATVGAAYLAGSYQARLANGDVAYCKERGLRWRDMPGSRSIRQVCLDDQGRLIPVPGALY